VAGTLSIRPIADTDRPVLRKFITEHWGAEEVIVHGDVYFPADLPGLICHINEEMTGLITYAIQEGSCEIVSLDSLQEGMGVGTALIKAVQTIARKSGCRRLWLVTTNDNLRALGFYQKRGFHLEKVDPGAVNLSRQRKPGIPLIGENGIAITDEITLSMELQKI
jgi:GNAT superfamily N-acetyltransferase